MAIPFLTENDAAPTGDMLQIPMADIYGLTGTSELTGVSVEDDGRIASGIMITIEDKVSQLSSPLGIALAKPNPTGAGENIFRQNISVTWSYYADLLNSMSGVFPLAVGATGGVAVQDVFPGASVVNGTAPGTDSVGFEETALKNYLASLTLGSIDLANGDSRDLIEAITRMVFSASILRDANNASGLFARTKSNAQGQPIPGGFFSNTTFSESDSGNLGIFTVNYSTTFEYLADPDAQTFELNFVTA